MELDLTSMMNLIGILIPTLLIQTAFVEVAVINILAPSHGGAASDAPPPQNEPLNLRLAILGTGYRLTATGMEPLMIPLIQKPVECGPFIGMAPPPRSKNTDAVCKKPDEKIPFWVYDMAGLTRTLSALKDSYPDERSIIIEGEPQTEYEAMTNAMDASRATKTAEGEYKELFGDVIIGGGVDS